MEGHGDVFPDSGTGKEGDSEGALLQIALYFFTVFHFSVTG